MVDVKWNLDLLGRNIEDRITRMKGVVSSVSFDLQGCVQALISPGVLADGKLGDSYWLDVSRLEIRGGRVMEPQQFDINKDPENKPTKS